MKVKDYYNLTKIKNGWILNYRVHRHLAETEEEFFKTLIDVFKFIAAEEDAPMEIRKLPFNLIEGGDNGEEEETSGLTPKNWDEVEAREKESEPTVTVTDNSITVK